MAQQDIITSITGLLNRTDPNVSTMVPIFLAQGVRRIEDECRLWFMEKTLPLSSSTTLSTNVSSSLLQIIDVTVTDQAGIERPMIKMPYRRVQEVLSTDLPKVYGRFGPNIVIKGDVQSWATATLYYYSRFTPWASLSSENELSLNAPELAIYAALTYGADFYRMDQLAGWETRYQQLKAQVIDQTAQLDAEGGPAAIEQIYRWD